MSGLFLLLPGAFRGAAARFRCRAAAQDAAPRVRESRFCGLSAAKCSDGSERRSVFCSLFLMQQIEAFRWLRENGLMFSDKLF